MDVYMHAQLLRNQHYAYSRLRWIKKICTHADIPTRAVHMKTQLKYLYSVYEHTENTYSI